MEFNFLGVHCLITVFKLCLWRSLRAAAVQLYGIFLRCNRKEMNVRIAFGIYHKYILVTLYGKSEYYLIWPKKVLKSLPWIVWVGPHAVICILIREREAKGVLETEMVRQWDRGGRDWDDGVTDQGMPGATGSLKKQGKASLLEPLEKAWLY